MYAEKGENKLISESSKTRSSWISILERNNKRISKHFKHGNVECFFQLNSSFHHYGFAYQKSDIQKQWTKDNKYILKIQLFTFLKDLSFLSFSLLNDYWFQCCPEIILKRYQIYPSYCWMPFLPSDACLFVQFVQRVAFLIDTNCFSVLLKVLMKARQAIAWHGEVGVQIKCNLTFKYYLCTFLGCPILRSMRTSASCSRHRRIAKVRKIQLPLVPSPSTEFGIISLIATHCPSHCCFLIALIDSIRNSCLTFFVLQTCKCIVYVCKIHNETLKRFICSYFLVAVFPEAVINFKLVHSTFLVCLNIKQPEVIESNIFRSVVFV